MLVSADHAHSMMTLDLYALLHNSSMTASCKITCVHNEDIYISAMHTEVDMTRQYLDSEVLVNQEIGALEVPVHYRRPTRVQVVHAFGHIQSHANLASLI